MWSRKASWSHPWTVDAAAHADLGKVRKNNEDRSRVDTQLALFAVADGMGGHAAGERASAMAVEAVFAYLNEAKRQQTPATAELLGDAITSANGMIFKDAGSDPSVRGMGTTFTALLLTGRSYLVGHVGDSRAWRVRDGAAELLTEDHSIVAEQLRQGMIDEKQADSHPMGNVLTRCLGNEPSVEVALYDGRVRDGDAFVLGSDGLVHGIDEDRIATTVTELGDAAAASRRIVEIARDADGRDNITAVVVRCAS